MELLVLLMGSNVGNREEYLQMALSEVVDVLGEPIASSRIWETAAWGGVAEDSFLNQAHSFHSNKDPFDLLQSLKRIERKIGRRATERWGNREIDVDILVYGSHCVHDSVLQIPHPRLSDRRFALIPLCEVAPGWRHPLSGQTVENMLMACTDDASVLLHQPFLNSADD
ncbi:MAG: 2-amino-4-hydroxy-6-hydroxymethyldihydropteridine diphosphokinase [Bacteroidia bacterium]